MASTASTLSIFCVLSGELASTAFPIEISSNKTVGVLKDTIIGKKPSAFEHIDANDLKLWRVTIPIDDDEPDEVISASNLDTKRLLKGTGTLAKAFKDGVPEDTIHIVIERPTGTTQTPESEIRIAELLEQINDLRGGKDIIVLNVVVRPNRSECFSWTTNAETTTIKELEKAIYTEYPDREDGDAVLAIVHCKGTPQHEGGGTERPSDDIQFRNIIKQYRKTNTKTIVVALETPTKKYADFTLEEVNSLYEISNLETPDITDLPAFEGISTEALESDLHKKSVQRLLDELDSRIGAMLSPSHTTNEATCSAYVCSFLTQAVLIFEGQLTLAPERPLRGRHGHGKVDYSIESTVGGATHILGVTEVKRENFKKGVAQNLVQLESSLTVRKRKRCDDDEEEEEEDKSVPLKAYGIVTDAVNWYFVECRIDRTENVASADPDRAKFRISKVEETINYRRDTWRKEATVVLSHIVWLMRKMVSEIPKRELRHKRQKSVSKNESSKIHCS
ncbi:hypothetical protein BGZ80_004047 [Entomortierella chlamydospora]|uniref:Crinkler effector protein N-terminal domain-containing protein n=1 Tax=Entomortierella chlamydospora TaxID=101097 RepID=A0A9P6MMJ0_9FUNG|nr:hypothetical protein BGZ79_003033 [Entomortierella chlamydospora]KAG0007942.1 hypothetical protein BGZ80_004047 [Entomortierella chlamydospora]